MMIGLAASIAIVVFLVCIVFIVYALRSRAARSHISILSLIILLLIGSSLGVYASVGRFSDWERAQVDNTKDHRLAVWKPAEILPDFTCREGSLTRAQKHWMKL